MMTETFDTVWEMVKMATLGEGSEEPADKYTISFTDENGNKIVKKFFSLNDLQRMLNENRLEKVGDRDFEVNGYRNGKLTYHSWVQ